MRSRENPGVLARDVGSGRSACFLNLAGLGQFPHGRIATAASRPNRRPNRPLGIPDYQRMPRMRSASVLQNSASSSAETSRIM